MPEQKCPKCGEMCEADDLDELADCYCCWECGESWCDTAGWADRMADHADNLRKAAREQQ